MHEPSTASLRSRILRRCLYALAAPLGLVGLVATHGADGDLGLAVFGVMVLAVVYPPLLVTAYWGQPATVHALGHAVLYLLVINIAMAGHELDEMAGMLPVMINIGLVLVILAGVGALAISYWVFHRKNGHH